MAKNIIENVFELCNKFIKDGKGKYVSINFDVLEKISKTIKISNRSSYCDQAVHIKCFHP